MSFECPCSSGNAYKECCGRFHEGALPENALQLMRSRYSAYVLNLADYIIDTTHPANPEYSDNKFSWRRSIVKFSNTTSFHKLEVLDFKEKATLAIVTFTVYASQDGQEIVFTEKSTFEKVGNRWLYLGGRPARGKASGLVSSSSLRLLPLAYYGDAVLRKKAEPVFKITDEIKNLIEEMTETMDISAGMGIAAPQVHRSIRLFIIRTPIETIQDNVALGEVQVFINPILSLPSEETWTVSEGCLSIPGIRAPVTRPKEITVEYSTLEGTVIKRRVFGWEARVIMHENDHIEGVLFIDRLEESESLAIKPFLENLEKRLLRRFNA